MISRVTYFVPPCQWRTKWLVLFRNCPIFLVWAFGYNSLVHFIVYVRLVTGVHDQWQRTINNQEPKSVWVYRDRWIVVKKMRTRGLGHLIFVPTILCLPYLDQGRCSSDGQQHPIVQTMRRNLQSKRTRPNKSMPLQGIGTQVRGALGSVPDEGCRTSYIPSYKLWWCNGPIWLKSLVGDQLLRGSPKVIHRNPQIMIYS